ncbi:transcriptional regulator [Streptomyces fructofermentans]|uniref:transcriptional regulator n=1 Tax=Streptomyces fructofermentans TaxID=152141 RepID=UPI0037A3A3E6
MPSHVSDTGLLVLHAVRLGGMVEARSAATRFGLDPATAAELLLDYESYGWVRRADFAGTGGWSLTERGRAENERQLAAELSSCGARPAVMEVHAAFLPLNARFQAAVTRWQVRPAPGDPLAANDHTDFGWDDRVIDSLGSFGRRLTALCTGLAETLTRFDGYAGRYSAAIARVERGERRWVDAVGQDSCHTVWFQFHEDLLATLGIARGSES